MCFVIWFHLLEVIRFCFWCALSHTECIEWDVSSQSSVGQRSGMPISRCLPKWIAQPLVSCAMVLLVPFYFMIKWFPRLRKSKFLLLVKGKEKFKASEFESWIAPKFEWPGKLVIKKLWSPYPLFSIVRFRIRIIVSSKSELTGGSTLKGDFNFSSNDMVDKGQMSEISMKHLSWWSALVHPQLCLTILTVTMTLELGFPLLCELPKEKCKHEPNHKCVLPTKYARAMMTQR